MKITVEFDNMEEFLRYVDVRGKVQTTFTDFSPAEIQRIMDGRNATKPAEQAQEEPAEVRMEDPAPSEEKPQKITEEYRVEVRKALATLNKMQTGNPAKALIAETGYKRLTDVPLEMLPDLMSKAQEAMNNA